MNVFTLCFIFKSAVRTAAAGGLCRIAPALLAIAAPSAAAATMSAGAVPPERVGDDISNIPDLIEGTGTATDKWWTDSAGSHGNPGMTVGQTFTTGNGAFLLKSVTFRVRDATAPSKTYTIRVGTVAGSDFTVVATETATQGFATATNDYWTWTFDTPVLLTPNTLYGVDVGLNSSTSVWGTGIPYVHYTTADTFSGGTRFRSGSAGNGIGDGNISQTTGDRIFHIALERPLGGPFELVATSPADDETGVLASRPLVLTFSQDIAPGLGDIIIRNLTDGIQGAIPADDSRLVFEENVLTVDTTGLLAWGKAHSVRIDAGAILGDGGAPFAGIDDDTTWNFTTAAGDPLLDAVAALKSHINGEITLTAAQIEGHKLTIDNLRNRFPENPATITAVFDLVETYDSVKGPLWVARGQFGNRNTQPVDLDWTMFHVMQYIMDEIYTAPVLAAHEALLAGFKFGSSANFPGSVAPPADPAASHTVAIQGTFEDSFGRSTQQWTLPARKPTGTYLAPGTIATVTVPPEIVNRGFLVRVGAHSWDLSGRPPVRRLDRATRVYPIDSTTVKVASPYGGGIYIEVPLGAGAGVIDVTVTGAVRAPYFSAKSFHQTTLQEWLESERHHPAPWADFQSDKFMMQVPTQWIYAHPDPVKLMEDWDKTIDAMNDLMGFPRLRGKETMYCQVDVLMRASVHAPGYPAINVTDNPNTARGGHHNNYLVRGPGNNAHSANIELHEQGHAYFFPKFAGETESAVNLPHVAAMQRQFGYSWDEAFRGSLGITNAGRTLDNTAITWMTSFNFSPRNTTMHTAEKSYQLKGHAKFVEIARLFGWDGLGDFWRSFMEDDAAGTSYTTGTDALLLRLSRHVGRDIRPLFHFWGVHPQNPASLANTIAAEGIPASPEIRALLQHYKSLVPANNAAFRTFGQAWWNKFEPNINGNWTETEHARQWDERIRRDSDGHIRTDITTGEMYVEACADQVRDRVQEIIDLYYPGIIHPDPMSFAAPPVAVDENTITMAATTAGSDAGGIEYFFENTTAATNSGWIAEPSWTSHGLQPGTAYLFRVKARDASGVETAFSATAVASTSGSSGSTLAGQLGILDLAANDGINPATGAPWRAGDHYRFAFVTSTDSFPSSSDIATYNAEVQALAAASPLNLGDVTWRVVGSTATIDARDNTGTHPAQENAAVAIFLVDGKTVVAANYAELWSGSVRHPINLMENGATFDRVPWPYTGTRTDGTRRTGAGSDRQPFGGGSTVGQGTLTNNSQWIWRTNTSSNSPLPYYALSEPLTVMSLAEPMTPFAAWAANFPDFTKPEPTVDFDGGGLASALEWVLGGDPTDPADDAGLRPAIDAGSDPDGKALFIFRRAAAAHADPATDIHVEYSTNLSGWTAASHSGDGPDDITITAEPDGFGSGIDRVTVALPKRLTQPGRLFARLRVVVDATP